MVFIFTKYVLGLESGRGGIIAASNLESHHAQGLTAQLVLGTLRFGQSKANGNGPTWTGPIGSEHNGVCSHEDPLSFAIFFFFIFKKIKISKIYVRFEKFRKYTLVALPRAT